MKKNKTILVTGGTGFIGNCFCKLILEKRPEWKVVNVDLLTYATNPATMEQELKNPNYVFYKNDIKDRDAIYKIFETEKPDIVEYFRHCRFTRRLQKIRNRALSSSFDR